MKTVSQVEMESTEIEFSIWDEEKDEQIELTEDTFETIAERFKLSVDILRAIHASFAFVQNCITTDLTDLWNRQDALDKRIKALEK